MSYSAWARACRPEECQRLLQVVATHAKSDKFQDEEYVSAWDEAYTGVFNHYIERVRYYAKVWLDTRAGKHFKETLIAAKTKGKKLPSLEFEAFRSFGNAKGMDWSLPQIADFFSVLQEYSDTAQAEHSVITRFLSTIEH